MADHRHHQRRGTVEYATAGRHVPCSRGPGRGRRRPAPSNLGQLPAGVHSIRPPAATNPCVDTVCAISAARATRLWRALHPITSCGLWLVIGVLLVGCAAPGGPEVLTIEPSQYDAAFDAALDVAADAGYAPQFRDRRTGVIATAPTISPSLVEPWRFKGAGAEQLVENTIAMQHRLVRFEFMPTAFAPAPLAAEPPLTGPAVVPVPHDEDAQPPADLTQVDAPLELRVWAYIERSHTVGRRRGLWTRLNTTRAEIPGVEQSFWVAVARDQRLEQQLLAAVQDALSSAPQINE